MAGRRLRLDPPSTNLVATEPIHAAAQERLALSMCPMGPQYSWTLGHTLQLLPLLEILGWADMLGMGLRDMGVLCQVLCQASLRTQL